MTTITIKTSTKLQPGQTVDAQQKLAEAYRKADPKRKAVAYEIVFDVSAPTLEAYGKVARQVVKPTGDQGTCYAIYLAAIAVGVPEDIAYAAYLVCLAS